jgi:hypothetical protein
MLALSVAGMFRRLFCANVSLLGTEHRTAALAAIAVYLIAIIVVGSILPAMNRVPEAFPAVVRWRFRVASFGMQLTMLTTLDLVFGALTDRASAKGRIIQGHPAPIGRTMLMLDGTGTGP